MEDSILDMLLASVSDLFPDAGVQDKCRAALGDLVVAAECALDDQICAEAEAAEVYLPGLTLFERHEVLGGEGGKRIRLLIEETAERDDLPKKDSRDFVVFLIGVFAVWSGGDETPRRQLGMQD